MLKLKTNVNDYIQNSITKIDKKIASRKFWYNFLNVFTFVITLGGAVITPIIMSKMLVDGFPTWFFFATAGIAAATGAITGALNFFLLKEGIKSLERERVFIQQELIKYNDKLSKKYTRKDAEYYLFTSIAGIRGSKAAKEEVGLE